MRRTSVLLVVLMLGCRESPTEPLRESAVVGTNAEVTVTMSPNRVVLRPGQEVPVTLTVTESNGLPLSSFSFRPRDPNVVRTIATVRHGMSVTLFLRGVAPGSTEIAWSWSTFLYRAGWGTAGEVIVIEPPPPPPAPSRRRRARS